MNNAIEIRDLTKDYGAFKLDHVSITVPGGTIMGLIGENGAGKSTTIKCLLDLIHPDSGTITLLGRDNRTGERAVLEDVGVVLDEAMFHDALTAAQVGTILRRLYRSWDPALFRRYLGQFSLPEKKEIKTFSRGMKMKLAIAAALSHHPDLLILDEPTSGLDPLVRDEILDIFLDFLQDETRAVILSSHITSDLDKVADTIALLHEGKLLFHEEKDVLREDYAVVKGGADQRRVLNDADFIGVHENAFGFEALCRRDVARRYPALTAERPTIEEIMLFYTRKKKGGRS